MHHTSSGAAAAVVVAAAALALAGCTGSPGATVGTGDITVVAAFYPLQFVIERVGGSQVTVTNLTPPAAEPHDIELAPVTVDKISRADLVVYESGFQAAVDDAVQQTSPVHVVDAADVVHLEKLPGGKEAKNTGSIDGNRQETALDPHFWLDPTRLEQIVGAVSTQLSDVDPGHADYYKANAAKLTDGLVALDGEYRTGLASCAGATLITSHEAFGYLAERYDLDQVGISGIDPEAEPSPARLRSVEQVARENKVKTLYTEKLLSPKVTDVLARDVGIETAVLDTIEGPPAGGGDYLSAMRANLSALGTGLTCQ